MNSIQLEYFLSVAKTGSFTRAAEKLFLSQPALSKQIRQLEEELGTILLIRMHSGLRLTPEGKELLVQAEEIVRRIKNIPAEMDVMHHTVSGELNIACGTLLTRRIMPDLLKRLLLKYPKICPHIRELTVHEQAKKLLDGTIDIGISNMLYTDKRLSYHPIFTSDFVLIRSVHSALAKKKRLTKLDVAKEKLICYLPDSLLFEAVQNILDPHPLNVFMDSQSSATIIELVKENFGIGFVPDYLIEPEHRNGIIVGGFDSGIKITVSYHYHPERLLSPQTRAFIDIIREKFFMEE